MRTIRYIALSDLHLGENNSLLTRVDSAGRTDPSSPSRTMEKLTACIRTLVESNPPDAEKPALILNGDILELALATMDQALAVFGHFLRLLLEPGNLFSEIIHIPGNHDHHLWETARETQYRNYIARLPEGAKPETPWHTTKIVMDMHGEDRLVSDLLTAAARRLAGLGDRAPEILVAYPNYGVLAATGDGTRSALFHHGHFLEDMYAAMSFATTYVNPEYRFPQDVYTLEQENFAWIDFFWSAMGRSGQVGGNIEQLYEVTRDGRRLRAVTDRLAKTIAGRHDIPLLWPDKTEEFVLKHLFRLLVKRVTRAQERQTTRRLKPQWPLSKKVNENLNRYLNDYVARQWSGEGNPAADRVTFIFGHTHKPFQGMLGHTALLNTGGWVVESPKPEPLRGAAMVLLDDRLEAVNLRLYNEGDYGVRVEAAAGATSELAGQVEALIQADPRPWRAFANTVKQEARRRMNLLKTRGGAVTGHRHDSGGSA